jgi:hypothetical protein
MLKMRSQVTRTFVADPRIFEIVQFSSKDLAFIGLRQGSTTLTLWFDNADEPAVILVECVAPPPRSLTKQQDPGSETALLAGNVLPSASHSDQSPQILARPRVPIGLRGGSAAGVRLAAVLPPRARYDGHAPWPTADCSAARPVPVKLDASRSLAPRDR